MVASIIVTDAGIQEVINAEHSGTAPVVLTQVGLGTGQYTPSPSQTHLQNEFKRLSANALSGGSVGDNIIYINARDNSNDAYTLYEFGIYTSSGTLFAVCSKTTPILQKVAATQAYLDIEFVLSNIDPASVTLGDTNFFNPPATTSTPGVIQIATNQEIEAGTVNNKAITPLGLASRVASTVKTGLVQLATNQEAELGLDSSKAITPAALMNLFKKLHEDYGYQKLPNGMIVQWGKGIVYHSQNTEILFPTSFPTKCTNIMAISTTNAASIKLKTVTNGNFVAEHNMNGKIQISWIAIGF